MSVNQKLLDAIELLTDNSVRKASYDKTIQAQVLSCEDPTIGKYRCRYQDAVIYAYSEGSDVKFSKGSYVYILVPGNDMSKEKTILGTTSKLGINYISQANGDQAYNVVGNNCVTSDNKFYLNTNNKTYRYTLYSYNGGNNNKVSLDTTALDHYIKQSSALIVGANFKTQIPLQRQQRGHYGITYNLRFLDNTSNKQVIRSYTVDEDNMVDNPYRLIYKTRQYVVFDIDGVNFIRVESIQIFNEDFPAATGTTTTGLLNSGDVEITDLELSGANRLTKDEEAGVTISFHTPDGTFFVQADSTSSQKTIKALVKVKGKTASSAQKIPFYWGLENTTVLPDSEYYNKYLGRGWKCLNSKNVIKSATSTSDPIVEWNAAGDTYIFRIQDATAYDNRLKVAIVYDGTVISKEINIRNLKNGATVLTIESDGGDQFYYDIGHPNLTCKVNSAETGDYVYHWGYESDTGLFTDLPETPELNQQYANAVAALETLQSQIAAGTKFANAEAENLASKKAAVKAFDFIQRVEGNKIYDVQINAITSFGIFKCSVYTAAGDYIGTAALTITNTLAGEDLYSLVINNGSVVFQYDEKGVAPNNKSLEEPQSIQDLSFTIYDNLGNPIDNQILVNDRNCSIRWQIPIENTLLVDGENGDASGESPTGSYRYYDGIDVFNYNIASRYNVKKQRNQIKLTVNYKGLSLTAETQFTFAKQGDPGTNGTNYVVRLIPNTKMSDPPMYPMITQTGSSGYVLNYGLDSTANETSISIGQGHSYQFLKAQLWYSGELVWEGFSTSDAALDGTTHPVKVKWEVLKNKYGSNVSDRTAFSVSADTGNISYSGGDLGDANLTASFANIIKCSITYEDQQDKKTYYGTTPFTTAWVLNDSYRVSLAEGTGFRHVIYASDGSLPQYDSSHPFEFICKEKINNIWEDVSLIGGSHGITEYESNSVGSVWRKTSSLSDWEQQNTYLLKPISASENQHKYKPNTKYDGECVNNAITCVFKKGQPNPFLTVGKIRIPIHFLLNRYGLSHINDWDGNSVQINTSDGYVLAPQIGAGSKDENNLFTGILMGEMFQYQQQAAVGKKENGLFGFSEGVLSIFLDAKTGQATFGRPGEGQILLRPGAGRDSTIAGWVIGTDSLHSLNKDAIGDNMTGAILKADGQFEFALDRNNYFNFIKGSTNESNQVTIHIGQDLFQVTENQIKLSHFEIADRWGRHVLHNISASSFDQSSVGISAYLPQETSWWMWFGTPSDKNSIHPQDYDFVVNGQGWVFVKKLYLIQGNQLTSLEEYIQNVVGGSGNNESSGS